MTPIGSRSAMERGRLAAHSAQRPRDAEHLLVRQSLRQRVGDPVGRLARAPGDEAQLAAVVEEVVLAPAHLDVVVRVVEDRRAGPRRALDAVVLAEAARVDAEAV